MGTGILICGLNGAGKSTLGKALAHKLHFYFIDNEDFNPFFQYTVLIDVPKDIRIQRVKNRSFQKFGNRMLVGGDLQEQEERFFDFVKSRAENTVEEWVQCLNCPIIRIDGTKPIEENINLIIEQISFLVSEKLRISPTGNSPS